MRERKPEEKGTSSYMNTICNTFKTFSVLNTLYFRNYLLLSGKKKKCSHYAWNCSPGDADGDNEDYDNDGDSMVTSSEKKYYLSPFLSIIIFLELQT